jgi:hypothetical protein
MLVCGRHFTPQVIERINGTVGSHPTISRRSLSLKVCDWLNWRAPNGKFREMSCRVALLKLHRRGLVQLPECKVRFGGGRRGGCSLDIEAPSVSCDLKELGSVELFRIRSSQSKASTVWNELMDRYHYLGAGPLCGAQIRYLIRSDRYGWLGGLAFSASAWRVEARDRWIGWSERARRENLGKIVCNSRFLILPQVKVPHLASHVLSLCAKGLVQDWVDRYGVGPVVLESFVERNRFRGTCYRAANWQHVGSTSGRGRQDRERRFSVPVKDVYVYPLCKNAREVLCAEEGRVEVNSASTARAEVADWAEEEFGDAELGDQRLSKRLVQIVRDFCARPQASIPQACQSRSKTKATYRFFDHPEISMDKILDPHYEATLGRARQEDVVLAVQDTTTLNYTAHPATENLGPIGYRLDKGIGLILYDTMAFNREGTPLGLMDVQCWARDPEDFGKKKRRHELPIERKESRKWLDSFRKVAEAQKRCPATTFVSVGDREADLYELFDLALEDVAGPKLLVRAMQNRALAQGQSHLWEEVQGQDVSAILEIHVPRRGSRASRVARLEVRFATVTLKAPQAKKKLKEVRIWAVLAKEMGSPGEVEPIEWMLLTTCKVGMAEEAIEKVNWYGLRWGIEVYHRTLKSGCKIEERQLGQADRIEACLAVDMVVAWRVYHLTKLGREVPDVPCTVFFEEAEWKALCVYLNQNPVPPAQPPTLNEMSRMTATLGGFLGRKCDGHPGTKSLWIGLQPLDDITGMWKIMSSMHVPHPPAPPVSSNPGYG